MPRKSNIPNLLLGNILKKRRISCGLTQKQLGSKLNLHRAYIGGVERGERNIGFDQLVHIIQTLNIGFDELNIIIKK